MKFIVGCDADGVLTDLSGFNVDTGRKIFNREPINSEEYSIEKIFDLSNIPKLKQYLKAFKMYYIYCTKGKARENSAEVIKTLSEDNCIFHSITARKFAASRNFLGKIARKWFHNWLKEYSIEFQSIQYCSEDDSTFDKLLACRRLHVDVMIEDKPDNALYLAENGVKVLLVDAPYNKLGEHKNIIRVFDWNDIKSQIQLLKLTQKEIKQFEKRDYHELSTFSDEEKNDYFSSYYNTLRTMDYDYTKYSRGDRIFRIIYSLMRIPMGIFYNVKVFNRNKIPYQDGFIIASNHCDSTDQYKLGIAIGNRPFVGFAAKEIKNTFRGKLFDFTGLGVFLDRKDEVDKKYASEKIASLIAHGRTALIFPEGTRKNKTKEGENVFQNEFKPGTVSIAQKTGTGILPVAINSNGLKTYVRFGEIQYVLPNDDIEQANIRLAKEVAKLSFQNMKLFSDNSDIEVKYLEYIGKLKK